LSIRISLQFTKFGLFIDYLHETTKFCRVRHSWWDCATAETAHGPVIRRQPTLRPEIL